jgi:hypothetical protein
VFDPARVHEWTLNVQMLQTNATYTGYFDNVRFAGPPDLHDAFEDRRPERSYVRIAPWSPYGYDAAGHEDILLNSGVGLDEASDGSQAAFLVAWYRADSGSFAGFGMQHLFTNSWSLPADSSLWRDYRFAFDFKERFEQPCILEMQVKNPDSVDENGLTRQHTIQFTKRYTPGSNGWDRVTASLDQFAEPPFFPFAPFDPAQVSSLVVNVQMLQTNAATNVIYVGWIDHVRFEGPVIPGLGATTYGFYSSANDSFAILGVTLSTAGDALIISWGRQGVLQEAGSVAGPWVDAAATSPAQVSISSSRKFYRLRR